MSKYHDDSTTASDPGNVSLSITKLKRFYPDLFSLFGRLAMLFSRRSLEHRRRAVEILEEHLMLGDSRAAIVAQLNPLLVAAYSDDLDCVVMLKFDDCWANELGLHRGTHLLTVNTYASPEDQPRAHDLIFGPNHADMWTNVHPLIADFLTDDVSGLTRRKSLISAIEWTRAVDLANEWLRNSERVPRDGAPFNSMNPATS
jgi:hypothetical protein